MDLSHLTEAEREACHMTFTIGGRNGATSYYDANVRNPSDQRYYGFTCWVSSIQMADIVIATLHYSVGGDAGTVSHNYSVAEYVDYVTSHADPYSYNAVSLVKAIADYGHYVQPFLAASNGWTVGLDHATMGGQTSYSSAEVDVAREGVSESGIVRDYGQSQIEKVTYALCLDSSTSIHLFLAPKEGFEGPVSATVDGAATDVTQMADGRWRIIIPDIAAHKLADVHNVVIQADGECTVQVSAMSYVKAALNTSWSELGVEEQTAHYAVSSLYAYYKAADAYKNDPAA